MRPAALSLFAALGLMAMSRPAQAQQKMDEEYGKKIKEYLSDPRISTELVDHLPASSTVPTPLKFLGKIVGTPGELTYAKDIHRYLEAIAKASPRAKFWKIGKTEEGRDMVMLAIGDEATIKNLEKYKGDLKALTDPRKTSEAEAQKLIKTSKPIYWITSGMHSPERGGPEMLIELAYRLVVEETPFVQNIRNNVITFITPVIEVDGREKMVDNYYFNKERGAGGGNLPLMYWGKYVQHDNNRDGMGQFLDLTKNTTKTFLEWTPTIMHDLHEAQTYLYASTGSGPYNESLDAITIDEWWMMAENDVMEMTKRGVPGVWTYGFYDGWVPNYMFFIAHSHNSIGRFYEVQSYGPDPYVVTPAATTTSREWFRPNPPLKTINWGPRANTNIQESAIMFSLSHVAKNRELYLENYWIKNKRAVDKGKNGPTYAWVMPAAQLHKQNAAEAVNDLRTQGLEIHRASASFKAGNVSVNEGDYIVRGDQPYRTLADMYFSLQNYAPGNPSPYDDTGWTFQLMRNLTITPVSEKSILDQKMSLITGPVTAPGGIAGAGDVIVVDNTADNTLISFRFKHKDVKMSAAEEPFEAAGHKFGAGAFILNAGSNRAAIDASLKSFGLSAWALASAPTVKTHDLDIPRIGYAHSWSRTQDEGWVRAALDTYGVPYTYFGDKDFRTMTNIKAKYDVIIYPHVGGSAESIVAGVAGGASPIPYKKSDKYQALGFPDSTDDIRGGMGYEGLMNLYKFVQDGGTLITEGATSTLFPEYKLSPGVTVENPTGLFARGTLLRGIITDNKSPLMYGYAGSQIPVYYNQSPVLNAGAGGFGDFAGGGRGGSVLSQNITPNATPLRLSPWDASDATAPAADAAAGRGGRGGAGGGGGGGGRGGAGGGGGRGGAGGGGGAGDRPRVVLQFPSNTADMLLSGTLANADGLVNRAQLVDSPIGKGHVVMFAIRPFWRWQTQGTYALGFNAILNWNDLNAGR